MVHSTCSRPQQHHHHDHPSRVVNRTPDANHRSVAIDIKPQYMVAAALAAFFLGPLRFLLAVFLFIISPVTATAAYFAGLFIAVLGFPVWLAGKIAVLYIYLGTASLVGICVALVFYLFYASIVSALGLDSPRSLPGAAVRSEKPSSTISAGDVKPNPSFSIPGSSDMWLGGGVSAVVVTSPSIRAGMRLSPTSGLSPSLATRQRIFPILEEEDEPDYDVVRKRRKGKNLKKP
ncbi:hypothetical protein DRE_06202 [Drechslerella stenobrocha 248]|uniref:Uncharacterized protein n=1 Tax=Drechslerella stenobrocha 248 TaxID=1043628 RepID=W7HYQ3_9PEZI|nr:hypothetical protein DRE_06202 [Drechslerella stenobrocha 248]